MNTKSYVTFALLLSLTQAAHASLVPMPGRDIFGRPDGGRNWRAAQESEARKEDDRRKAAQLEKKAATNPDVNRDLPESIDTLTVLSGRVSYGFAGLVLQTADGRSITLNFGGVKGLNPQKLQMKVITVAGRPGLSGFDVQTLKLGLDTEIETKVDAKVDANVETKAEVRSRLSVKVEAAPEADDVETIKGLIAARDGKLYFVSRDGETLKVLSKTFAPQDPEEDTHVEITGERTSKGFKATNVETIRAPGRNVAIQMSMKLGELLDADVDADTKNAAPEKKRESKGTEVRTVSGKLKKKNGELYLQTGSGEKIVINKVSSKISNVDALVGSTMNAELKFKDGVVKLRKVSGGITAAAAMGKETDGTEIRTSPRSRVYSNEPFRDIGGFAGSCKRSFGNWD